nr:unnamed protein product [Callosobruchus analis]
MEIFHRPLNVSIDLAENIVKPPLFSTILCIYEMDMKTPYPSKGFMMKMLQIPKQIRQDQRLMFVIILLHISWIVMYYPGQNNYI